MASRVKVEFEPSRPVPRSSSTGADVEGTTVPAGGLSLEMDSLPSGVSKVLTELLLECTKHVREQAKQNEVSEMVTQLLHECTKQVKQQVKQQDVWEMVAQLLRECTKRMKQEVGEMVQVAVEQAVGEGAVARAVPGKGPPATTPLQPGAAQPLRPPQHAQQQHEAVHPDCVRLQSTLQNLQSTLQNLDNNVERLVLLSGRLVRSKCCVIGGDFNTTSLMLWPRHNGVSVEAVLGKRKRPKNADSVMDAPDSVIDALLRHYELPHGDAAGSPLQRRRALLQYLFWDDSFRP